MINFKERTLRNTNNFINLSLLGIITLLNYLYIFTQKHGTTYRISLEITTTIITFLPIYYLYKQFSAKGKYITVLPLSMKKTYIITFIEWLIVYLISIFIVFVLNKIHYGNDTTFYTTNISYIVNEILNSLKINFMIISGIIIVKFYKKNWIVILGVLIAMFKTIDLMGDYYFLPRYRDTTINNILGNVTYSIVGIGIFILSSILFVFMLSKLDKLSIE